MNRIQERKKAKRNSKKFDIDPLTGKPVQPAGDEALKPDAKGRPLTAA